MQVAGKLQGEAFGLFVHHRSDDGRTLVILNMIDAGIHFARGQATLLGRASINQGILLPPPPGLQHRQPAAASI